MDPLREIDLNLLLALSHLLETGSVQAAARELGVGQPAMSASLARLRRLFDDPLLIRSGRGMLLSQRALELRGPTQDLVDRTRGLLAPVAAFDPTADAWAPRVALGDETRPWLAPRLVRRVAEEAPRVDLRIRRLTFDSARAGRTGEIDLAAFPASEPGAGGPDVSAFVVRPLYTLRFALVCSADHPLAGRAWTLAEYAAAEHVLVTPWEGSDRGFADEFLEPLGLSRRVVVTVPTFEEAVDLVRGSRRVSLLPERCARGPGLWVGPVPWGERRLEVVYAWHPRAARDPRIAWLRRLLVDCAAEDPLCQSM